MVSNTLAKAFPDPNFRLVVDFPCRYSNVRWLDQDDPSGRRPGDRRLVFTLEKSGVGTLLAKYVTGDYRQDLHQKLAALDLTPEIHEVWSKLWNRYRCTYTESSLRLDYVSEPLCSDHLFPVSTVSWKQKLHEAARNLSKAHKHGPWQDKHRWCQVCMSATSMSSRNL